MDLPWKPWDFPGVVRTVDISGASLGGGGQDAPHRYRHVTHVGPMWHRDHGAQVAEIEPSSPPEHTFNGHPENIVPNLRV